MRQLREEEGELPHFIFVTAYEQHAVEAFRLKAMDYLLKPVDKGRLAETIERARRVIQEKKRPDRRRSRGGATRAGSRAAHQAPGAGQQPQLHRGRQ